MKKIVLLRHGESAWNKENRFTGWYDVDLSEKGVSEAKAAGKLLKEEGYSFQLNLMSLSGYYGPHPKVVSEKLLKQKMYDFVGTDLHHLERYRPMLDQLRLTRRQLEALEGLIANNARI